MNVPDNVNVALLAISSFVSAVLVPLITNFLTARNASGAVKQAVAVFLSVVVGLVAVYIAGAFDLTNIAGTLLLVIGAAKAGYEVFDHVLAPVHEVGPQLGAKPSAADSGPVGEVTSTSTPAPTTPQS